SSWTATLPVQSPLRRIPTPLTCLWASVALQKPSSQLVRSSAWVAKSRASCGQPTKKKQSVLAPLATTSTACCLPTTWSRPRTATLQLPVSPTVTCSTVSPTVQTPQRPAPWSCAPSPAPCATLSPSTSCPSCRSTP